MLNILDTGVEGGFDIYEYNHLVGPRLEGEASTLNYISGKPVLSEKLRLSVLYYREDLYKTFGDAGVSEIILATDKNMIGSGFEARGNLIWQPPSEAYPEGALAYGAQKRGTAYEKTCDGYLQFNKNKIYISKYTARELYRGSISARETLFHEYFHANDWHDGIADWLYKINGENNFKMSMMMESLEHINLII